MKNGASEFLPLRKEHLVRELSNEVILFDTATAMGHCLNHSAAAVWKLCNGENSVAEIARILQRDLVASVDEKFVWAALHQLHKSALLQNEIPPEIDNNLLSRRDLVKTLGSSAALLPIATSIRVLTPAQASPPPVRPRRAPLRRQPRNE